MQLSKLENKAYNELKNNGLYVFNIKDIMLILGVNKVKAYNLIKALKRKNAIRSSKSGIYALYETPEFVEGAYLNWPSYISFWTALNYHKLSDQMPKTVFYASIKYKKQINNFKYITIAKSRFFGYKLIDDIVIAEKEKAIADSLLMPKYAGGIREINESINHAIKEINLKKLINYALKMKSKAVIRRLGYILEQNNINKIYLNKLLKKIGNGYELLDPTLKKKNNYNTKWLLDINI